MNQVATRKVDPIVSFRGEAKSMESEIARALPPHIPVERFMRVVITAVQTSMSSSYTNLLECDRRSLWQACMRAAQDGLLPDGREGAVLPYMGKAQWLPMVAGIRKKARNSGEILSWDVNCVYANDTFMIKLGDSPGITHTFDFGQPRGDLIGCYSVAILKDGAKSMDAMGIDEIRGIRDRSQAWIAYKNKKIKSTPWSTDESEMARKTMAKRHAKQLPSSADLDDLIRRDDELYNAASEEAPPRPKIADFSGQIASSDTSNSVDEPDPQSDEASGEVGTGDVAEQGASPVAANNPASVDARAKALSDAFAQGEVGYRTGKRLLEMPSDIEKDKDLNQSFRNGWKAAELEAKEAQQ